MEEILTKILSRLDSIEQTQNTLVEGQKAFESNVNMRFEAIDKKFEAIDKKFEAIDIKFEAIDNRFISLEKKMDNRFNILERKIDAVYEQTAVLTEFKTEATQKFQTIEGGKK